MIGTVRAFAGAMAYLAAVFAGFWKSVAKTTAHMGPSSSY